MTTVVCGTDLSEGSLSVERVAASVARLLGARIELFHVVQLPPFLAPDLLDEDVVADLRAAAEATLADHASSLRASALDVTTTARVGTLDELWYHARDTGAAVLVIGTHARTGAARFVIGSFAERSLTTVTCPVLVVPPHPLGRLAAGEPFAGAPRLLVGVDGSPASDAALAWVGGVRRRSPCDVRLLHLFVPAREHERLGFDPPSGYEVEPEVLAVLARELGTHTRAQLGEELPLRVRPAWGGEEDPLAWEAETDDADLLVIGTSQTRRTSARATVRGSRLPVLCVPGHGVAALPAEPAGVRSLLLVVDFAAPAGFVAAACRQLMPDGGDAALMHVAAPEAIASRDGVDVDEIETCLLGLMPTNAGALYHARTFVTANRSRGEAVVKAVRRFAPDLVVLSMPSGNGRSATSVIEHVVRHSPKPVVVFPAPQTRPDA